MYEFSEELNYLANLARQGDSGAARQLQDTLQPQLRRIVRRTLRAGVDNTPLARQILAEARRSWPALDEERHIGQVATRVCESLVEKLATPPARQWTRDTVLA